MPFFGPPCTPDMDYPQARAINAGRIAELKKQTAIVLRCNNE
jgi:hypothetical protein